MPAPFTNPLHIILHRPEIPQNTGNIGRMCSFTDSALHLIKPLGFELTDRYLKRSGMDYWKTLNWEIHDHWEQFKTSPSAPRRIWLFTTHAKKSFWDVSFQSGDGLLFGNEGHGCPDWLHEEIGDEFRITLPCFSKSDLRSLNLATSVGIACYEALRQIHQNA